MTDPADPSAPYALVVDDDGFIRMDAMDILADAGFRTFEASDGDRAVALLEAVMDLCRADAQMSGDEPDPQAVPVRCV